MDLTSVFMIDLCKVQCELEGELAGEFRVIVIVIVIVIAYSEYNSSCVDDRYRHIGTYVYYGDM